MRQPIPTFHTFCDTPGIPDPVPISGAAAPARPPDTVAAMTTATPLPTDPGALTPIQWATRLAAYSSRGRTHDDPVMLTCQRALAYWKVRRVIDAERGQLDPAHLDALTAALHTAQAVTA